LTAPKDLISPRVERVDKEQGFNLTRSKTQPRDPCQE
jgi:hypothetical protein